MRGLIQFFRKLYWYPQNTWGQPIVFLIMLCAYAFGATHPKYWWVPFSPFALGAIVVALSEAYNHCTYLKSCGPENRKVIYTFLERMALVLVTIILLVIFGVICFTGKR